MKISQELPRVKKGNKWGGGGGGGGGCDVYLVV